MFEYSAGSERRVAYLTLCYVVSQLGSGLGPVVMGRLLNATQGLSGSVLGLQLNSYTPMFAAMLALAGLGLLALMRLRRDRHPQSEVTEGAGALAEAPTEPRAAP